MNPSLTRFFLSIILFSHFTYAESKPLLATPINLRLFEQLSTNHYIKRIGLSAAELESQFTKLKLEKPIATTAHVGQTILFLITMASLDLTYQKIKLSSHTEGSPDFIANLNNLASESAYTAVEILNSGNTWSSMFGAGVAASLVKYPIRVFTEINTHSSTSPFFREILQKSIVTTAAFMGWDAGSQLWTEAIYLLEDKSEYKRATELWGVGSGALSNLLFSNSAKIQDQKDLILAKKLFSNVLKVALYNPQLRSDWLNNVWRTHIMTGSFVTYLSVMITLGNFGNTLNPGGGAIVGFMLGIAGATVASIIPSNIKDKLTLAMIKTRNEFTNLGLLINGQVLLNQVQIFQLSKQSDSSIPIDDYRPPDNSYRPPDSYKRREWSNQQSHFVPVSEILQQRHSYRSDLVTTIFEAIRLELKQEPNINIDQLKILEANLNDFFTLETKIVKNLLKQLKHLKSDITDTNVIKNIKANTNISDPVLVSNLESELISELGRIHFIGQFLKEAIGTLVVRLANENQPIDIQSLPDETKSLINFVEVNFQRGFCENKLMALRAN